MARWSNGKIVRAKKPKAVRVNLHGMEATGRTITEAKEAAGKKIEAALTGYYNPKIIAYRDRAKLVYRTPDGWFHQNIMDEGEIRQGTIYGNGPYPTMAECLSAANQDLAQLTWEPSDGTLPPVFLNELDARGFSRWAEHQLRYRDAKAAGWGDNDAHDYAGKNPARPELWQKELPRVDV